VALVVPVLAAPAAAADTAPPATAPATVSSDVLPTVQVNGVVWAQLVVGDRVYATGQFTHARPAGAAPGVAEVPRSNILAFDIRTGVLIDSWAPALNAQGQALAASADGTTVFVGGSFTQVNGTARNRIAAIDAASGALKPIAVRGTDARVRSIAVSGGAVYIGGIFTTAGNQPRSRLAAYSTTTGELLPWAPAANAEVMAMTAASGKLVVGGRFTTLNGAANYGLGALDPATAAVLPFPANQTVRNAGPDAAIYSLVSKGSTVFGTGYTFGSGGNLEDTFSVDAASGNLNWVSGCRGDTYAAAPLGDVLYTIGHAHDCAAIGYFPEQSPRTWQRALAYRSGTAPDGRTNSGGSFAGRPAPEALHWLPSLAAGDYTGQAQAAWSAVGNEQYLVLGGEFPSINGVAQQGLARFAVRAIAPNADGPQGTGSTLAPTMTATAPGTVRGTFTAAFDRDNNRLTYELLRGPQLSTTVVVASSAANSSWFSRPLLALSDPAAPPGTSQSYRIRVTDPLGNRMVGPTVVTSVPAGAAGPSAYRDAVLADAPSHYWRLGEASGATGFTLVGARDLVLASGTQRATAGAVARDSDPSTTFPGTAPVPAAATGTAEAGPQSFSVEAWVRTSSTRGGKVIGFGNRNNAASTTYDRHVYMTDSGQLVFGVNPGSVRTVTSPGSYNDGQWHHVVGTLGAAGLQLYVDGQLVAGRADTTSAQAYSGYWRVAGDTVAGGWPTRPSSSALAGSVDEVAVYGAALPAGRVLAHSELGRGVQPNRAPTASFTEEVTDQTVTFDATGSTDTDGTITTYAWDFGDGQTGTGASPTHSYAAPGSYTVTLTVTDDDTATGTTAHPVTATAPPQNSTVATDSFDRSIASGFGTANTGGAWVVAGTGGSTSVSSGSGLVSTNAGKTLTLRLPSATSPASDVRHALWLEQLPTGGGSTLSTIVRSTPGGDYRARVRVLATGEVQVSLTKVVAGTETALTPGIAVPGLTYAPGQRLVVRAQAVGTAPTTLRTKVWVAGAAEPVEWQRTITDSSTGLQESGSVGFASYLSASATAPVAARLDDFVAVRP
jgi:PKD repeat protein